MSKKPNLSAVKSAVHKDKFKHGSMAVVFTAVFIAIIIVINILVSALTDRFPSMNFDLTLEGLNTLSDEAVDVAKSIEEDTTIYIIGSEDAVRGDQVYTNYGLQYSQVANLADRLQEQNSKIHVEFIDPDLNPTFISSYPDDNLTTGKVMVSSEKRNKVLSVTDLFSIQQDTTTGEHTYYPMVDGALPSVHQRCGNGFVAHAVLHIVPDAELGVDAEPVDVPCRVGPAAAERRADGDGRDERPDDQRGQRFAVPVRERLGGHPRRHLLEPDHVELRPG